MHLHRIWAIILRQIFLMRGSFSRVLPLFSWVAIDMVLWGFMSRYLNAVAAPSSGLNFVPTLLGAVLLWDFFIRVMQGVTMAFFEDVWSRNFLNVFASPLRVSEYLAGLVFTSISTSLVGLIVMLALATTVFGLSFLSYGWMLVPALAILFIFGIALGIVASAIVLRYGPASEWFVWPIPALLSPFAGVFYPLATLPEWMQAISRLLPPSYVFEQIRAITGGEAPPLTSLAVSGVLVTLYLLGASFYFRSTFLHAVRTGLLARYSAETVS